MGVMHVTVALKGLGSPNGTYEADFLVDTGATDSLAPAAKLKKIGVQPVGTMSYELADGSIHEYQFGLVQIEFMGEITAGRVISPQIMRSRCSGSQRLSQWALRSIRQTGHSNNCLLSR